MPPDLANQFNPLACQADFTYSMTPRIVKMDPHIVGSNRPQDQLWPPSSILGFYSPGHQLYVVALQSTDFQALEGTRHKNKRLKLSLDRSHLWKRTSDYL